MIRITRRSASGGKRKDCGYMLLVLMLAVAVLTITMFGVVQNYRRSIQRDKEVEMIHRGEQYERAVRRFYRKNNRYPVSLEQLEGMNKIRYLRKRYKDPMSPDGEWKIAHATDIKLKSSINQPATGTTSTTPIGTSPTTSPQAGTTTMGSEPSQGTDGTTGTGITSTPPSTGSTGSAFGSSSNTGLGNGQQGTQAGVGNAANGQVLGGGDVYGVVSKSKQEGFHSYGDKSKYNEWFFIYDFTVDKGQLLIGPYNPKMFIGTANSGLNSTGTTATGSSNSNTGTSSSPTGLQGGAGSTSQPNQ